MKRIDLNLFPGAKKQAVTMSYDDGRLQDLRLAGIFDKYGFKATFHLNSGLLGEPGYISPEDVSVLARRHEISVHTLTHPHLETLPPELAAREITGDRLALERLSGTLVQGMSFPFGSYSDSVLEALRCSGILFSRTTQATNSFKLPESFLLWHPTTHHKGDLSSLWSRLNSRHNKYLQVLYIWGHSYEFDNDGNWEHIEEFCRACSGRPDTWYATNIEIYRYARAVRRLEFSMDFSSVYNPSACDVWLTFDGSPAVAKAGATTLLEKAASGG